MSSVRALLEKNPTGILTVATEDPFGIFVRNLSRQSYNIYGFFLPSRATGTKQTLVFLVDTFTGQKPRWLSSGTTLEKLVSHPIVSRARARTFQDDVDSERLQGILRSTLQTLEVSPKAALFGMFRNDDPEQELIQTIERKYGSIHCLNKAIELDLGPRGTNAIREEQERIFEMYRSTLSFSFDILIDLLKHSEEFTSLLSNQERREDLLPTLMNEIEDLVKKYDDITALDQINDIRDRLGYDPIRETTRLRRLEPDGTEDDLHSIVRKAREQIEQGETVYLDFNRLIEIANRQKQGRVIERISDNQSFACVLIGEVPNFQINGRNGEITLPSHGADLSRFDREQLVAIQRYLNDYDARFDDLRLRIAHRISEISKNED